VYHSVSGSVGKRTMDRQWTNIIGFLVSILALSLVAGYFPGVNEGTSGQLAYYANTGQSVSGEAYLSNAQTANTPQANGALCNGQNIENAAMLGAASSVSSYWGTPGTSFPTSTTVTAPAVTTTVNDALVITTMFASGTATFTPPGTPTQRVSGASTATVYGVWMGDQQKATAGTVAAQTGTESVAENTAAATLVFNDDATHSFTFKGTVSTCQVSSGTCTLNVPSGTSNGDLLVACMVLFDPPTFKSPVGTLASNWNLINFGDLLAGSASPYCFFRIAASEPASYTNTNGGSGWMADYGAGIAIPAANTLTANTIPNWAATTAYTFGQMVIDNNGNTERAIIAGTSGGSQPTWGSSSVINTQTTDSTVHWTLFALGSYWASENPNFNTTATVGMPICVARVGATNIVTQIKNNAVPVHKCGTIASIVNNNTITTSFNASAFPTMAEARWGTDDHAALQTWLNSLLPAGKALTLPAGACVTTTSLNIPTGQALVINGAGDGHDVDGYNQGSLFGLDQPGSSSVNGSNIWWLTDSLSAVNGGLVLNSSNAGNQAMAALHWRDFTLWFGAGIDNAGGSGVGGTVPGLYLNNVSSFFMDGVKIGNASGDCMYDTAINGPGPYLAMQKFINNYFTGCGGRGAQLNTGTSTASLLQQVDFQSNIIQHNGFEGIKVTGSGYMAGIRFGNNIIQRDDVSGTASLYEVNLGLTANLLQACSFTGSDYFEDDTSSPVIGTVYDPFQLCSRSPYESNLPSAFIPINGYQANYFDSPPQTLASFPTCNSGTEGSIGRATTCASVTAGTTCSGGGTTHAQVVCNGTNWVQMGY